MFCPTAVAVQLPFPTAEEAMSCLSRKLGELLPSELMFTCITCSAELVRQCWEEYAHGIILYSKHEAASRSTRWLWARQMKNWRVKSSQTVNYICTTNQRGLEVDGRRLRRVSNCGCITAKQFCPLWSFLSHFRRRGNPIIQSLGNKAGYRWATGM